MIMHEQLYYDNNNDQNGHHNDGNDIGNEDNDH